jgi:hypothetical protein
MLFDLRGRRRHVIRVVYGLLAFLMGASLLLVIGPFSIGELVGGGGTTSSSEVFDEQAERIERRLASDPKDEALLLSLTRARINAGNAAVPVDPETGAQTAPGPEAQEDFARGLEAWNRYLKQAGEKASPSLAQVVAITAFGLAERGSTTYDELESNVHTAATAQRIVAEQRPNVGSLTSLAIYEYFDGNFAAGDEAVEQATAKASNSEAKNIKRQLAEYRKNAEKFVKQKKAAAKAERGKAKEAIENPLGGLGSSLP